MDPASEKLARRHHGRSSEGGQQQRTSPRFRDNNDSKGSSPSQQNNPRVVIDESSKNFFSKLLDLLTVAVACVCGGGLLTLLFVLYFTVRPFSVSAYRRLSAQLGLACFLDALVLLLPSVKIHLTGDSDVPSPVGTSILVSNHLCDADWWYMFMLGRSVGLQGTMKAFLRNEYLHVNMGSNRADIASKRPSFAASVSAAPTSRVLSFSRTENVTPGHSGSGYFSRERASPDVSLAARLLHLFLDFPLVNGEDYIADRENLFRLIRSFAAQGGTGTPVHFLSFPEGWCLHNGENRDSILAKSNDFAQKEGRPQLRHLLLPRTRGFNATLECLRESNPVVYDATMAYEGYDGSLPPSEHLALPTLWSMLRGKLPSNVYVRVKRYSLEEVLQDSSWLDKKWQEKDKMLAHFARHGSFPADGRGYCRHRVFDTWSHSIESSLVALSRLLILPCVTPILFLLSIPIFWALLFVWLVSSIIQKIYPGFNGDQASFHGHSVNFDGNPQSHTPGSEGNGSATGTPFMPATPFASPTANWFSKRD